MPRRAPHLRNVEPTYQRQASRMSDSKLAEAIVSALWGDPVLRKSGAARENMQECLVDLMSKNGVPVDSHAANLAEFLFRVAGTFEGALELREG